MSEPVKTAERCDHCDGCGFLEGAFGASPQACVECEGRRIAESALPTSAAELQRAAVAAMTPSAARPAYSAGFTEVAPGVHASATEIVVFGQPSDVEDENDPAYHNCDAMGCGRDHVVYRAKLAPTPVESVEALKREHEANARAAHHLLAMDRARMDFLDAQYCGVDFEHRDFPGGVILIRIPRGGRVGPDLRKTVDDLRELA